MEQALQLRPVQSDVDMDRPGSSQADKCRLEAAERHQGLGTAGRSGSGGLRRFLDTDGDNKLDQWCYYKDGIEIYRDIDSDKNGRADQYRWLGTAGTRWGIDRDEDGKIDSWKQISAEEVSAEAVNALKKQDVKRLKALLRFRGRIEVSRIQRRTTKERSSK